MFFEQYGVTLEDILELIGRGLLKPILSSAWYRYIDIDYLDPILEKNPPSYFRLTSFFNVLSGKTYLYLYENGEKLFRNKLNHLKEVIEWERKYPYGKEAFETKICYDFARLRILFPEVYDRYILPLLRENRLERASKLIVLFDEILVDIYTSSLEGHHKVSRDKFKKLYNLRLHINDKRQKNIRKFPTDIANLLVKRLKIHYPSDITVDELLNITKEKIYKKAMNALELLDKEVSKKEEKLKDRSKALKDTWHELSEAIGTYDKIKNQERKIKSIVTIGVFGCLRSFRPHTHPLDILGDASLSLGVAEKLSSKFIETLFKIKMRKRKHIVSFWEYKHSVGR